MISEHSSQDTTTTTVNVQLTMFPPESEPSGMMLLHFRKAFLFDIYINQEPEERYGPEQLL